jgi:hypothetical protein
VAEAGVTGGAESAHVLQANKPSATNVETLLFMRHLRPVNV